MNWTESAGILLAGVGTLAIYSFLYKENKFYRLFEHIFIGVSVGVGVVETIKHMLLPKLLSPLWAKGFTGLVFRIKSGAFTENYGPAGEFLRRVGVSAWQPMEYFWLFPAAFGSLYYTIYSRRYNWLARLVIGFGIGAAGGAAFEGFFTQFLPQIMATFRPVVVFSSPGGGIHWGLSILNIVITLSMLCTMVYFVFTVDRSKLRLERPALAGRYLMMISFGAIFGSTVTARLALLIERLRFLADVWVREVYGYVEWWGGGIAGLFGGGSG